MMPSIIIFFTMTFNTTILITKDLIMSIHIEAQGIMILCIINVPHDTDTQYNDNQHNGWYSARDCLHKDTRPNNNLMMLSIRTLSLTTI